MNPIPQLSQTTRSPREWQKRNNNLPRRKFGKISGGLKNHFGFGKKNKKFSFKKIATVFLVLLAACFLAGSTAAAIFFFWAGRNLPNPNTLSERLVAQSTKIYDKTGETVLYDIHGAQKRTLIKLEELPDYVKWSTIALEDKKFYVHHGFDPVGFARAIINNVLRGYGSGGGSTLTQQLVKNAILTSEKTLSRKIKELILSLKIEQKFTKDEILQMYLNEIPYGSVSYGVEAAAQTFFGKSAKDMDLAEAALLAALPQATTYYSPYGGHKEQLVTRAHYCLDQMFEEGYITAEEREEAKKVDILSRIVPKKESIIAPHFVMYIKEILIETYGEKMVEQGGLKVTTTLDLDKQTIAETAINEQIESNEKDWKAGNAAFIALDPKTGQILAMVGSRDYFDEEHDGAVNVTLRPRQPGSSFKPIVYTAAFIKGFTPSTVLYDVFTTFKTEIGKDYEPHNYNNRNYGPVTIKQALAGSLNIPAVKTLYLTGVPRVLDLAESFGYTTFGDRSRFGLSLVLGGGEVKLIEHVNAFSVFATEGEKHKVSGILKVEDSKGRVLEEWRDQKETVVEPQYCRLTTNILSDNNARAYIFGMQNWLTLGDRPVAAKTGTTNDFHDAWTIGFTPSLAAGVWVGNSNNDAMKEGADGSVVAAPIWNKFMKEALKDTPVENFTPPEPIVTGKPRLDGAPPARQTLRVNKITGEPATAETPPELIEKRVYQDLHSILYYINKDDPRGSAPFDPDSDLQFQFWEESIKKWAEAQGIYPLRDAQLNQYGFIDEETPANSSTSTEENIEQEQPDIFPNFNLINVVSPENGATVSGEKIEIIFQRREGINLTSISYFIDGYLVARDVGEKLNIDQIYSRSIKVPKEIKPGDHTIRMSIYDSGGNSEEKTIGVKIE